MDNLNSALKRIKKKKGDEDECIRLRKQAKEGDVSEETCKETLRLLKESGRLLDQ